MDLIKSQITLVQVLALCDLWQVSICTKLHNQHHGVNEFQMPGCFSAAHPCVKWKLGKQIASVLNLNSCRNHWQPSLSGMESLSPQTQSLSLSPGFHFTANRIALSLVGKIRVTSLMILINMSVRGIPKGFASESRDPFLLWMRQNCWWYSAAPLMLNIKSWVFKEQA